MSELRRKKRLTKEVLSVEVLDQHGEDVRQMFDRIASGYDRANRWMSMGIDVRWRQKAVCGLLGPDSEKNAKVLDLCAGTLDSSLEILHQYPQAHILAGDFSLEMLRKGQSKLTIEQQKHIDVLGMDAHAIPLASSSLDAIFCAFGVRNLSDLSMATRQQARCLRAGGQLTILEFFQPKGAVTRAFHAAYNHTLLPIIGWAASGDRKAYRYLPKSIGRFVTLEQYKQVLQECGFSHIQTQRLSLGVAWIVRATIN